MYLPVGAAATQSAVSKDDPIAQFGTRVSATIMAKIQQVPSGDRKAVLQETLDAIDPSLYGVINEKAERLRRQKGYSAREALSRAIAAAFANNLVGGLMRLGKKAQSPSPMP